MRIRTIRRYIRKGLVIVVLSAVIAKGHQYLPSLSGVIKKAETVSVQSEHSPESKTLKEYLPQDMYDRPEQLLFRKSYVVSYNSETKCPNWVLWKLTREQADGTLKRPDYAFHEDEDVPMPRAGLEDYHGSGYDRGHMCPAGDNKWDADAMYESFLLTNICPQNQQLNSGLWNQIEMSCRYWAKKYGSVYIICGPIYLRGEHQSIGYNKVMVPEAFFKAVICLENEPKGIAFVCKNTKGDRKKDYYVNTIRQVERITGYTLFPNLDEDIAEQVKDYADIDEW